MVDIIASFIIGLAVNQPIDTNNLPKKTRDKIQQYAIYEDNRIVIWKKEGEIDKRRGFLKNIRTVPVYLN